MCIWQRNRWSEAAEVWEMSHSHHREVAALPPEEQDGWLGTAENHGWSQRELHRAIKDEKRGIKRGQLALDAC